MNRLTNVWGQTQHLWRSGSILIDDTRKENSQIRSLRIFPYRNCNTAVLSFCRPLKMFSMRNCYLLVLLLFGKCMLSQRKLLRLPIMFVQKHSWCTLLILHKFKNRNQCGKMGTARILTIEYRLQMELVNSNRPSVVTVMFSFNLQQNRNIHINIK